MTDVPETRWAKSETGALAYQVFGSGDRTIALIIGAITHVEKVWAVPEQASFLRELSRLGRVVLYDERGMGASDPVPDGQPPTLEERVDDLMAVLDAAGIDRADLVGFIDGGAVILLASLTYPDRVDSLSILEGYARLARDDDYPVGLPRDRLDGYADLLRQFHFDDDAARANLEIVAPSVLEDVDRLNAHIGFLRGATSPSQFVARTVLSFATDVRDLLPLVKKPTLVLHGRRNRAIPVAFGRYLADRIPGCRYVEVDHADAPPFFESRDAVLGELAHFLGRRTRATSPAEARVLATVLFTDIVDSTALAAELGDREWRTRLEEHDRVVSRLIGEYRGTLVKTTGDGALATFDGPSRAVSCAREIRGAVVEIGFEIRAGVHTGEIETRDNDVAGMAVHVAARIMGMADPGEIRVSSTVRDLAVGSGIEFDDRGMHIWKGVPDEWHVLSVRGEAA